MAMNPVFLLVGVALVVALSAADKEFDYYYDDYRNHPCIRSCPNESKPMVCEYDFTVEDYFTLSKTCVDCPNTKDHCFLPQCVPADGHARRVITVNRRLPGPAIQVCEDDEIVVRLNNAMDSGTSIHWHGILQKGTPYMDGVAMVTQCFVATHGVFEYKFKAADRGTHFWHSHAGVQRAEGMFGPLIVRPPPNKNPHASLYDVDSPDHVIMITDWAHTPVIDKIVGFHHKNTEGDNQPDAILINGLGNNNNVNKAMPVAIFRVQEGKSYRFRVISSGIYNCPIQLMIDDHALTVLSSDGSDFDPVTVDVITLFPAERFDFVLKADGTKSDYLIKVFGTGSSCKRGKVFQTAILTYRESDEPTISMDSVNYDSLMQEIGVDKLMLNPYPFTRQNSIRLVSLNATELDNDVTGQTVSDEKSFKRFYLGIDFTDVLNPRFDDILLPTPPLPADPPSPVDSPQINDITFAFPQVPPLTQCKKEYNKNDFCTKMSLVAEGNNCNEEHCSCVHRVVVEKNDVVELFLYDRDQRDFNVNHPIHFHGHRFRVLNMGEFAEYNQQRVTSESQVRTIEKRYKIPRGHPRSIYKDTVMVPNNGFTIIRFKADNPGLWFLHCHIEYHLEIGMALLIQVGGYSDFPSTPKGFPTCPSFGTSGSKFTAGSAILALVMSTVAVTLSYD